MNSDLVRNVGSTTVDNLFAKLFPAAEAIGVTVRKLATKATIKRGTIMAKSSKDNKLVVLGNAAASGEEKFDGDGTSTTFTLAAKPAIVTGVIVGTAAATITSYDATTGKLTLSAAPADGTDNVVVSFPDEVLEPFCILSDDVEVGTSEDATAVAYRTGNFNRAAVIVATDYTVTEADEDHLRAYDIIFTDMM